MNTNHAPGIYIHIPFCVEKCRYCDFYSLAAAASGHAGFVAALVREIASGAALPGPPDTVYFGGGTPSILGPAAIERILSQVAGSYSLAPDVEITLEANPGTLKKGDLTRYRAMGINRLNLGVQSFDDKDLAFLGRCHRAQTARLALDAAKAAGFDNLGFDLIYGLPGQSPRRWKTTLAEALARQPAHLSCYILSYEPGTALTRMKDRGSIRPLSEEKTANLFSQTADLLADAGYDHYEISNFARNAGSRSRHNQKYWHHVPTIGFGPAAHTWLNGTRRWNIADLDRYTTDVCMGRSPVAGSEVLSPGQMMTEIIYLGLRTREGIHLKRFEETFGLSFSRIFSGLIKQLSARGLLECTGTHCALSRRAMRYHDHITEQFIALGPDLPCAE